MNETQKIEMNKQYRTRDGRKVRVLCTDCKRTDLTVLALVTGRDSEEFIAQYYSNGRNIIFQPTTLDLIEYNPAQDLKVDDKIWVRDNEGDSWKPRHFSSYSDGRFYCWEDGGTSHTQTEQTWWIYWKKD